MAKKVMKKKPKPRKNKHRGGEEVPVQTKRGMKPVFTDPDVIEVLACEMALGMKKYELKALLRKIAGRQPSKSKFEQVLAKCRALLHKATNVTRDEAKGRSLSFYLNMAYDRNVEAKDRVKAMERVDAILGTEFRYTAGAESPLEYAEKVREFLRAVDAT